MKVPERLRDHARPTVVHEPATPGRPAADVVVWELVARGRDIARDTGPCD
jgi:hypothetical protein